VLALAWAGQSGRASTQLASIRRAALWSTPSCWGCGARGKTFCVCPFCRVRVTSLMYAQDAWRCRLLKRYPKTIELTSRGPFAAGGGLRPRRRPSCAGALRLGQSVMDGAGAVTETILWVQAAAVLIDIRPTWPHDRCISLNSLRPKTFPPARAIRSKPDKP
jgi:hypothetical protein